MKILGYDTGAIACRAAFTSDFAVPSDMPVQQLVNNLEKERPSMDIRSGMRHKYVPLRFDPRPAPTSSAAATCLTAGNTWSTTCDSPAPSWSSNPA